MSQSASLNLTIVVGPGLTVTAATLPSAVVGSAYPATSVGTPAGGTAPYTWAVTAGALPPGMSLSAAGVLSGTPTAAGNFAFTATVTDSTP